MIKDKLLIDEFIDEDTGEIIYPESDGEPMAESTTHFEWITTIKNGLESVFEDQPNVFVAGDLLWYPVEGTPHIRNAPDVIVVLGRAKGHRGSYEQWKEGNIAPQVVFEILSKGNTTTEMLDKQLFYEKYGVQEYYLYDFRKNKFFVWHRDTNGHLQRIEVGERYQSPLLRIYFEWNKDTFRLLNPDETPFLNYLELMESKRTAEHQKQEALQREHEALQREQTALQEIERLKNLLKQQGINPSF